MLLGSTFFFHHFDREFCSDRHGQGPVVFFAAITCDFRVHTIFYILFI